MSIYVPPRPAPVVPAVMEKAGPIGPGAGVLTTEFPLALILGRGTPQERMKRNLQIASGAGWPDAAENAIATTILREPWVLEDPEEVEVDDAYPNPLARMCFDIVDRPAAKLGEGDGAKYTRSELWRMTLRHSGICGSAFWFLNRLNAYGWPESIKYVAPWRMTPNEDPNGNLKSWQIDKTPRDPGIEVSLEEIIHFFVYPPDVGHFGRSQLEIALLKAQNDIAFDKHVAAVLAAGGRLSGLLSPKQGESISDGQYNQIVADARTIVEQPEAAKRLHILRGPVEFQQTTMTISDLQLVELLKLYRDDTLSLWGVPPGYLVAQASGLNSGEARKYDKQVLWENANHARVEMLQEAIQLHLVDRWDAVGLNLRFDIVEPSFDDDSGRFDLVEKSLNMPMRNSERRALVNLEPFGPSVIVADPLSGQPVALDDLILLPQALIPSYAAPEAGGTFIPVAPEPQAPPPPEENEQAANAAGEQGMTPQKASTRRLASLRTELDNRYVSRVQTAVAKVLGEQRIDVIQRARSHVEHLMSKPADLSKLWDGPRWDRRMRDELGAPLRMMAIELDQHIRGQLGPAKAGHGPDAAVEYVLTRGGTRITALNNRTRDAVLAVVRSTLADSLRDGLSPAQAGDALEAAIGAATLDNGGGAWDELRAETIARTETGQAYNDATIGSYRDAGVEMVEVIDGDDFDEACAEANGQIWSLDEAADRELEHPNCTRDFLPVLEEEEPGEKAVYVPRFIPPVKAEPPARIRLEVVQTDIPAPIVNVPQIEAPPVYVAAPDTGWVRDVLDQWGSSLIEAVKTKPLRKRVIRDKDGRITEVIEEME